MLRRALILVVVAVAALAIVAVPATGAGTTVRAKNFKFVAKTVTIPKGGKVTWKNVQGTHTVTFKTLAFNKTISGSKSVSKTFGRKCTFAYVCRFHKSLGMRGTVVVN